ncbi:TIGR03943 family putative permease subunit [Paenibacillus brasilensis]|uniref:Repeat protein (TIGR03943 family) n=1 Tax=Paenibacillus brasilensis TaxID=128574 RepID=A0ABU0KZV5_9BACL|nr:TIGR03943 family protein [Paenibacillus brasilensis]MDQ0493482.1 putative repeat protein (TIGR03943 family) [Paenibacillus brasilensis]
MNTAFSIRWQYGMRSLLMIGLALHIILLSRTNALHYYLAPHMQKLLLLCPVPLLFIALAMAWHGIVGERDGEDMCDCKHPLPQSGFKKMLVYGMLLIPLLFGALLPNQALGSDMAAKKGMSFTYPNPDIRRKTDLQPTQVPASRILSTSSSVSASHPAKSKWNQEMLDKLFVPPDKYNTEFAELAKRLYQQPIIQIKPEIFSETIGAIELYKHAFEGKKVQVTGFVYKDSSLRGRGLFAVGRFLVMCCTADAMPFGIIVQSHKPSSFDKDTWVTIEGTLHATQKDNAPILEIRSDKITEVRQPKSPYVYTQADSVAAFDRLNAAH